MAYYPFKEIEEKWQKHWQENGIYKIEDDFSKPKFYVLDMFPYPSGAGLHIGHPEGYTATDILARFKRMKGYNVLHPMGFDAFGLPTERYCMEKGIHPVEATNKNIDVFRRQLDRLGLGYDWSRSVNTTDPSYYRWTQWMFILIYNSWYDHKQKKARHIDELPIPETLKSDNEIEDYKDKHRLAYIDMIPVNWCEQLGTVLANEEVDEWREKGYRVERRPMRQWMLRITEYAQRLLDDLELVDWPESTKEMQKNWIGRSEGAEIVFHTPDGHKIPVFTTRPDTVFGATYMVLAPEHPVLKEIVADEQRDEIEKYQKEASFKSDLERMEVSKEKTGVFTGAYAVNPATGKEIPIWIADYVLLNYGTGAIMAVPAHDQRDLEFASVFNLPIVQVTAPAGGREWDIQKAAFTDEGIGINSGNEEVSLDGLRTDEAKTRIIDWLEKKGIGKGRVQFRLWDWLFSRQRYWGEPIPIMFFEDGTKRALDPDELPLKLPELEEFKPSGSIESPLALVDSWVNFIDPKTGKKAGYETNTMPQWAGSCWYYLRYMDPRNDEIFCDKSKEEYWMKPDGIDLYVGGAEHAVLHLLYARFWHKVLYDYGYVSTPEPFKKLFHQGLIMGEVEYVMYIDDENKPVSADNVSGTGVYQGKKLMTKKLEENEIEKIRDNQRKIDYFVWRDNNKIQIHARTFKMSKSRGNVINPDVVVDKYGADSLRVFEMFLGPLQDAKPWSDKGIEGVNRFLNRVWRLMVDEEGNITEDVKNTMLSPDQEYILHSTIKKVGEDIEELHFNTAVSQMMIFVNEFNKEKVKPKEAMEKFVLCLAPFAPHIAEELWQKLGNPDSVITQSFPEYDTSKTVKQTIEFVVQVQSKIRAKLQTATDTPREELEKMALGDEKVQKHIGDKQIRKVIFVPNKLLNFIVG